MRLSKVRGARYGACGLLALLGAVGCGSSTHTSPSEVIVETRVGTVAAHQLAFANFSMPKAGLVTLKVDPVLLLTLRSGKAPEEFGAFITNSDNGGLTSTAPAGTNSVLVGNPFDVDKAFTLSISHP